MMFAFQIEKLIKKKIQSWSFFSRYLRPLKFPAAVSKKRALTHEREFEMKQHKHPQNTSQIQAHNMTRKLQEKRQIHEKINFDISFLIRMVVVAVFVTNTELTAVCGNQHRAWSKKLFSLFFFFGLRWKTSKIYKGVRSIFPRVIHDVFCLLKTFSQHTRWMTRGRRKVERDKSAIVVVRNLLWMFQRSLLKILLCLSKCVYFWALEHESLGSNAFLINVIFLLFQSFAKFPKFCVVKLFIQANHQEKPTLCAAEELNCNGL